VKQSKNGKNQNDPWHNMSKMQKKMPHLNVPILDHPQYLPSIHHYTIYPYVEDITNELKVAMQMTPTPHHLKDLCTFYIMLHFRSHASC
jgi:hypothetical protein